MRRMGEEPAHEPHADLREGYVVSRLDAVRSLRVRRASQMLRWTCRLLPAQSANGFGISVATIPCLRAMSWSVGPKLEVAIDCFDRGAVLDRRLRTGRGPYSL